METKLVIAGRERSCDLAIHLLEGTLFQMDQRIKSAHDDFA